MDRIEFPPNYSEIIAAIPAVTLSRPVFAWGDDIYNPYRLRIDRYLRVHEAVHGRQQHGEPAEWWRKYLNTPEFRLTQELEAYKEQLADFARSHKNREDVHGYARMLAGKLSGPMYANLIDSISAYKALRA